MNVTFTGYLALTCTACKTKTTIESGELKFEQDLSVEAEEDEYIRYITEFNSLCIICSAELHVKLDVWEYPEAAVNYSYYDEKGVGDIDCEFNIEHYFENKSSTEDVIEAEPVEDDAKIEEGGIVDQIDTQFNDVSSHQGYIDHYDDDN